ncbi:MAG TPA: hypothetical protein VK851_08950, partial [Anaerolineales bacterium]|nr:hypothetical protein [Anaerolineales bacterium]
MKSDGQLQTDLHFLFFREPFLRLPAFSTPIRITIEKLTGQKSEICGDGVGVETKVEAGAGLGVLFGKAVGEPVGKGLAGLVG